jgi:uncharacterized protein YhbP (UPF0306 family)
MFVMRSKVKVNVVDAAQTSIAGVRGVQVQARIEQYFAAAPVALTVLQGRLKQPSPCQKVVICFS